jgi:hypothetical protein
MDDTLHLAGWWVQVFAGNNRLKDEIDAVEEKVGHDAQVRVVDLLQVEAAKDPIEKSRALSGTGISIGNMPGGGSWSRPIARWPKVDPDRLKLNLFFVGRNGGYIEHYRRVRVQSGWALAISVEFGGKIVFEEISESYPRRPDGSVEWD